MSDSVQFQMPDLSGYMTTSSADSAIAGMNTRFDTDESRIAALEAKKGLALLATATLGETTLISLSLGVKRYNVTATGASTSDRIVVTLTGAPQNGTLQDAYVVSANTVSVGILAPALGIGATISVPIAIYRVI